MRRGQKRVALAIQPTSQAFGYAVLELATDRLVGQGMRFTKPSEMEQRSLPIIADLISAYSPSLVIVEDTGDARCLRSGRGPALIDGIVEVADTMDIAVGKVPSVRVREFYRHLGARNKDAVAGRIVERFPQLARLLPARRKSWMSKQHHMAIFDAIAFATVFAADNPSLGALLATQRD